jgi:hypothetical protein
MRRTVTVLTGLFMLAGSAQAQTPASCNANLFDQAISRDKITAGPGDIVNYRVALVNRSVNNTQVGCHTLSVTANFRCPAPDGQPTGTATNLVSTVNIPANDAIAFFGPFACTMPDADPAFAGVFGTGLLDDGGPSPFLINKTISVEISHTPPPPATQIPTLSSVAFSALGVFIVALGALGVRRRRAH